MKYFEKDSMSELEMLSVVALTNDIPEKGLRRGQVGTVVEKLASDVYEVDSVTMEARLMRCFQYQLAV